MWGGNTELKIIEDFYKEREPREYEEISPTLRSDRTGLKVQEPVLNKIGETTKNSQSGAVYDVNGISQTLCSGTHGYVMGNIAEPCICASRGRNPDNPSDRTAGAELEQRFEINENGTSNTLTSVAKDNYVVEPSIIQNSQPVGNAGGNSYLYQVEEQVTFTDDYLEKAYNNGEISFSTYIKRLVQNYGFRIRKLTPLECIRLMDFDDSDYEKVKAIGMSDSQIYKQCGNSIVVRCLEKLFDKMFIHTEITEPKQLSLFD